MDIVFPPKDFSYGGRKQSGDYEHHPILPKELRTPALLTEALVAKKRLMVPEVIMHKTCAETVFVGNGIMETLLVSPKYNLIPYRRLFCSLCRTYCPAGEFVFADNGEPVDPRLAGSV